MVERPILDWLCGKEARETYRDFYSTHRLRQIAEEPCEVHARLGHQGDDDRRHQRVGERRITQ